MLFPYIGLFIKIDPEVMLPCNSCKAESYWRKATYTSAFSIAQISYTREIHIPIKLGSIFARGDSEKQCRKDSLKSPLENPKFPHCMSDRPNQPL